MSTWFQQHRVEWIAETVLIFGFINREHIQKKFGVSTPQASLDINLAIQTYPGLLTYNTSVKRYELAADHTAAPRCSPPSVARIRSAMDGEQEAMPTTGQPPVGMASPTHEEVHEWLIRKDGYFYRPNSSGYTTSKFEAGRYTKAEAEAEAAVEPWHMKAIHQDDVEDDPVSSRVRMDGDRIATLAAEVEQLTKERDEAVEGAGNFWIAIERAEKAEAEVAQLRERISQLEFAESVRNQLLKEERDAARTANERDRTEIIIAVNALTDAFARRDWLLRGGRGNYEWDDDRFRDEFRGAMEEFEPHIDRLRKIGADRTNCPETWAEVQAARAEASAAVKVKALEWRHFDNGNGYVNTPAGLSYAIYANGDWCLRNGPMLETVGGTLDSAKAAAQADYERRIRSALDEVFPQAGKNFTTQPAAPQEAEPEGQQCERCQGNGEIVTDWERYRHPHDGDVGDEAVAECPDCNGEGAIAEDSAPQEAGR